MSQKHERPLGDRHFYCFVDFQEPQKVRPLVYVLPAAVVVKVIAEAHQKWLRTEGPKGKHKDNPMRRLLPDYQKTWASDNPYPAGWMETYRDAWHLLNLEPTDPEQPINDSPDSVSDPPDSEDDMSPNDARQPETIFQDKVMLVDIDELIGEQSVYDAARYAWKASLSRAKKLDYVLAARKGTIVGVFEPIEWLPATPVNFSGFPASDRKRIGFHGHEAPPEIQARYCGKPAPIKKRGDQNPVHYYGGG